MAFEPMAQGFVKEDSGGVAFQERGAAVRLEQGSLSQLSQLLDKGFHPSEDFLLRRKLLQ
jgi:hypothetical protein